MHIHWLVITFLFEDCMTGLRRFGWHLTHDWMPIAFPLIALIGAIAYGAYLEHGFCQREKQDA